MKKTILLAIAAILFSSHAVALGDDYSYYGVTLNYAYSQQKFITETSPEVGNYMMLNGFNAGFMFQQQLYKGLVLVSGLQYQFTMASGDIALEELEINARGNATTYLMRHSLRVPVKFGFSTPFANNWSFTVFAGPSLDFNVAMIEKTKHDNGDYAQVDIVSGKYKYDVEGFSGSETKDEYKRMGCFDIPLGLGAIVKYKSFGMKFEYEWGMLNLNKDKDPKYKIDQFSIGFFYTF